MKNTLEGINSRLGDTEKHIRDLEDRKWKSQSEQQKAYIRVCGGGGGFFTL